MDSETPAAAVDAGSADNDIEVSSVTSRLSGGLAVGRESMEEDQRAVMLLKKRWGRGGMRGVNQNIQDPINILFIISRNIMFFLGSQGSHIMPNSLLSVF